MFSFSQRLMGVDVYRSFEDYCFSLLICVIDCKLDQLCLSLQRVSLSSPVYGLKLCVSHCLTVHFDVCFRQIKASWPGKEFYRHFAFLVYVFIEPLWADTFHWALVPSTLNYYLWRDTLRLLSTGELFTHLCYLNLSILFLCVTWLYTFHLALCSPYIVSLRGYISLDSNASSLVVLVQCYTFVQY